MDRLGAIVERYAYDPYGLPLIRESAGRGDMNNDSVIDTGAEQTRFNASLYPGPTVIDARSDVNDDGNRDSGDSTPWAAKEAIWDELTPTVAQAYSDIDNPFMFQGTRHFAIDTGWSDTTAKLPLNHHRARFAGPCEGRWVTRDPLLYQRADLGPNWDLVTIELSSVTSRTFDSQLASQSTSFQKMLRVLDSLHEASTPDRAFSIMGSNTSSRFDPTGLECRLRNEFHVYHSQVFCEWNRQAFANEHDVCLADPCDPEWVGNNLTWMCHVMRCSGSCENGIISVPRMGPCWVALTCTAVHSAGDCSCDCRY